MSHVEPFVLFESGVPCGKACGFSTEILVLSSIDADHAGNRVPVEQSPLGRRNRDEPEGKPGTEFRQPIKDRLEPLKV
jgi:hypothetical protein